MPSAGTVFTRTWSPSTVRSDRKAGAAPAATRRSRCVMPISGAVTSPPRRSSPSVPSAWMYWAEPPARGGGAGSVIGPGPMIRPSGNGSLAIRCSWLCRASSTCVRSSPRMAK